MENLQHNTIKKLFFQCFKTLTLARNGFKQPLLETNSLRDVKAATCHCDKCSPISSSCCRSNLLWEKRELKEFGVCF